MNGFMDEEFNNIKDKHKGLWTGLDQIRCYLEGIDLESQRRLLKTIREEIMLSMYLAVQLVCARLGSAWFSG